MVILLGNPLSCETSSPRSTLILTVYTVDAFSYFKILLLIFKNYFKCSFPGLLFTNILSRVFFLIFRHHWSRFVSIFLVYTVYVFITFSLGCLYMMAGDLLVQVVPVICFLASWLSQVSEFAIFIPHFVEEADQDQKYIAPDSGAMYSDCSRHCFQILANPTDIAWSEVVKLRPLFSAVWFTRCIKKFHWTIFPPFPPHRSRF